MLWVGYQYKIVFGQRVSKGVALTRGHEGIGLWPRRQHHCALL